jgi:hypothetical protein
MNAIFVNNSGEYASLADCSYGGSENCNRDHVIIAILNGDHSPNVFRQTSLLFHKWLAERFNLDDA